jgi:hypothetical protein
MKCLALVAIALLVAAPVQACGWYMMAPPYEEIEAGHFTIDYLSPRWENIAGIAYPTWEACDLKQAQWAYQADRELTGYYLPDVPGADTRLRELEAKHSSLLEITIRSDKQDMAAKCIPSDDPRLAR